MLRRVPRLRSVRILFAIQQSGAWYLRDDRHQKQGIVHAVHGVSRGRGFLGRRSDGCENRRTRIGADSRDGLDIRARLASASSPSTGGCGGDRPKLSQRDQQRASHAAVLRKLTTAAPRAGFASTETRSPQAARPMSSATARWSRRLSTTSSATRPQCEESGRNERTAADHMPARTRYDMPADTCGALRDPNGQTMTRA
jgi:hypothetical protein